ncbi:hypothetical protein [Actinacidiphila glaucinigra]|nr:hypothetical protein [Actinacidiphila glaucinigra]
MAEATELGPVVATARTVVTVETRGLNTGQASAMADELVQAARKARTTLADVTKYPEGRRARADEIIADAQTSYNEWRARVETIELVYLAELRAELFKAPTGTAGLIARQDAEQFLRRRDIPLQAVFQNLVRAGGDVAQLAVSPWLEIVAASRNADAKELRKIAEAEYMRRNAGAEKLTSAPIQYAKIRAAMAAIARECLGVNASAFAKRALYWGNNEAIKDAEIDALRAQLVRQQEKQQ